MPFHVTIDPTNQLTIRVALTGRSARLLEGTPNDFLKDPGAVLMRIQANDGATIRSLISVAVPEDTGPTVLDNLDGPAWSEMTKRLFDEVLSFFQPEQRDAMSAFLRDLNAKRLTMLEAIQLQIGGLSASNSPEKPEPTSNAGQSENS